jgi:hypothetical protein
MPLLPKIKHQLKLKTGAERTVLEPPWTLLRPPLKQSNQPSPSLPLKFRHPPSSHPPSPHPHHLPLPPSPLSSPPFPPPSSSPCSPAICPIIRCLTFRLLVNFFGQNFAEMIHCQKNYGNSGSTLNLGNSLSFLLPQYFPEVLLYFFILRLFFLTLYSHRQIRDDHQFDSLTLHEDQKNQLFSRFFNEFLRECPFEAKYVLGLVPGGAGGEGEGEEEGVKEVEKELLEEVKEPEKETTDPTKDDFDMGQPEQPSSASFLTSLSYCTRCHRLYYPAQNNPTACLYHDGQFSVNPPKSSSSPSPTPSPPTNSPQVFYSCCSVNVSGERAQDGRKFWIIGRGGTSGAIGDNIDQIMHYFSTGTWASTTPSTSSSPSSSPHPPPSTPIETAYGTSLFRVPFSFSPKPSDLSEISLMLVYDLDEYFEEKDEAEKKAEVGKKGKGGSLEYLLEVRKQWEKSVGLCMPSAMPILVGISSDKNRIPSKSKESRRNPLFDEVFRVWNCSRFMIITIGSGNSVLRSFLFLGQGINGRIHRGCRVSSHQSNYRGKFQKTVQSIFTAVKQKVETVNKSFKLPANRISAFVPAPTQYQVQPENVNNTHSDSENEPEL